MAIPIINAYIMYNIPKQNNNGTTIFESWTTSPYIHNTEKNHPTLTLYHIYPPLVYIYLHFISYYVLFLIPKLSIDIFNTKYRKSSLHFTLASVKVLYIVLQDASRFSI